MLRAVAAEVAERLWARGELTRSELAVDWTDLLWTAQRELGARDALEPRLIVLGTLMLIDPDTMHARVSALLRDRDRVVRLWAVRNLRPSPGTRSAELIEAALGPQETGRSAEDYRLLAQRLLALQQQPPRLEVQTPRGSFVWELRPAAAPLATLAFLDWTESGFFDGVRFHRVIPDFVVQAGDPTAVGYGGAPGSLRSEETPIPFAAGVVGLALAGRDTGGSQFFITQSSQPHLTGAYPVLGRVIERANVIERIQQGDRLQLHLQ